MNEKPPNEAVVLFMMILILGGGTFLINGIIWSIFQW
tara:strand:+ start:72 stop:182 length:111 start_codon:yes stop_codon:yes gene_type:complete